jgi:mannosyl-3-phosphoglycerate synthase
MLACLCGKKYIGFIDSDNYFPGAVLEYVREYSAGFVEGKSHYTMVRISWQSKPKIVESGLFFAKRGRASEHTNRVLNQLLSYYTGFGTEIIKTGNAGEHAMTMNLAMKLDYSSGYSIEPYHYINMLEKFGGILDNPDPDILKQGLKVYQIESRNPHLHEVKGDEHVKDMSRAAFEVIHNSPICPDPLKKEIVRDLRNRDLLGAEEPLGSTLQYYPALETADMKKFAKVLKNEHYAKYFQGDLSRYPVKTDNTLVRDTVKTEDHLPGEGYLEAK